MSVRVDAVFEFEPRTAQAKRHGSRWCHLWADAGEVAALHAMATKVGLRRSYFQPAKHALGLDHYDLTPSKRAAAIRFGAVETNLRKWLAEKRLAGERKP